MLGKQNKKRLGAKFLFDPAPIYYLNYIKGNKYFVAKKGGYGIIEYRIGAGLKFGTIPPTIKAKWRFSLKMTEAKKTVLFEKHTALAGKGQIVPFAGWMMPVWYQSISAEHEAVRKRAGLFDCTHMAVLKIAGENAGNFLNSLTTNDVSLLKPGKAQYSYILNFDGDIIDDVIVYCISNDNFMMVANAANEQRVKDWIAKVRLEKSLLDSSWQFDPIRYEASKMPDGHQKRPVSNGVEIKDLKNPSLPDARVDIALQGPASAECLKNIFGVDVSKLKSLTFTYGKTKDLDVIISATGYTGAKVSFELFVHPDKASLLWDTILKEGKSLGVIPCGLGARDSLRIEAGLPLYGHELAGEFNISPFQAGYPWAVKLQKKNFIGKEAMAKKAVNFSTEVARLKFDGSKGVRPIRQFDGILTPTPIPADKTILESSEKNGSAQSSIKSQSKLVWGLNNDGICIGQVLSCAGAGDKQIVLALIQKEYNIAERQVGVYYLARNKGHIQQGRKEKVKPGDSLTADIIGKVVERFEKF